MILFSDRKYSWVSSLVLTFGFIFKNRNFWPLPPMRSVKTDSLIWRDNLLKNWRKLVWLLSVNSTTEATPRCKWHFWAWLRGVIDSSRFCAYANISARLKPYSNILHSIWVRDPDEFEPLKKGIKNLVTLSLYFKLSDITTTNQIRHSEGGIFKISLNVV